jgi:hypothetical protein
MLQFGSLPVSQGTCTRFVGELIHACPVAFGKLKLKKIAGGVRRQIALAGMECPLPDLSEIAFDELIHAGTIRLHLVGGNAETRMGCGGLWDLGTLGPRAKPLIRARPSVKRSSRSEI